MKLSGITTTGILFFLFSCGFFYSNAQTKTTNLYDLINSALPDSAAAATGVPWHKGININSFVNWRDKTAKSDKETGGYAKGGTVDMIIASKKSEETSIYIMGKNAQGYSRLEISLGPDFIGKNITDLLEKKQYTATLVKKGADGSDFYKLKFPNKKEVWLIIEEEDETAQSNFLNVRVFFDSSEFRRAAK